jgi:hypothetical protein
MARKATPEQLEKYDKVDGLRALGLSLRKACLAHNVNVNSYWSHKARFREPKEEVVEQKLEIVIEKDECPILPKGRA